MTESNPQTDGRQQAGGKRPWGTPRIVVSELANRTRIKTQTSTLEPLDKHVSAGSANENPS